MSNLADHLRKHLRGEVLDSKSALDHFSTDSSIFTLRPRAVIYPRGLTDIRKIAKFSWQLAERGKKLPITVRGKGTDQGGGAIGDGLVVVMPTHMNRLLDLDKGSVTVQPGMIYGDLQRTLYSHGCYLPSYPASMEYSTVGGAVANNASGERSLKYGTTADFVSELEVVLANGDVIRTRPLSKRELNRKKGEASFEGDIYRKLDGLLIDNADIIDSARPNVKKNSAGYALWDVRRPDGTFDLTRLIVGSQGTLGIVSEITFNTRSHNPNTHLMLVSFDEVENAGAAAMELNRLEPSAIEMVDYQLLNLLHSKHPELLEGSIEGDIPKVLFLVEFDDEKDSVRKRKVKKAQKALREQAQHCRVIVDQEEQEDAWKLRRSAAALIWQERGSKTAVPIIEDGIVPEEKLAEFLQQTYALFDKHGLEIAIWGHAGSANLHLMPFIDLSNAGDRQKVLKIMDDFYEMVIGMGGSTSGDRGDGRLRGQYLSDQYGDEVYTLFKEVKAIFDPKETLNPGVKLGVDRDVLRKQMRQSYDTKHLYDHLPHIHQ